MLVFHSGIDIFLKQQFSLLVSLSRHSCLSCISCLIDFPKGFGCFERQDSTTTRWLSVGAHLPGTGMEVYRAGIIKWKGGMSPRKGNSIGAGKNALCEVKVVWWCDLPLNTVGGGRWPVPRACPDTSWETSNAVLLQFLLLQVQFSLLPRCYQGLNAPVTVLAQPVGLLCTCCLSRSRPSFY